MSVNAFLQCFESDSVHKPEDLKGKLDQVSLGKDDDGYYVYTHRCRSKSYSDPHDIPQNTVDHIASTG